MGSLRTACLDESSARIVRSSASGARCVVAACKTLACSLTRETGWDPLWALCVLPVGEELDLHRLASATGSNDARLATPEELRSDFRQPRGSIGPIGPILEKGVQIVIDDKLCQHDVLECGAGAPEWQLHIHRDCLLALPYATSRSVCRRDSGGRGGS